MGSWCTKLPTYMGGWCPRKLNSMGGWVKKGAVFHPQVFFSGITLTEDMGFKAKKKNMCGSGYSTYSNFLPPTLNFFLHILKLGENSRTK